MIAPYHALARVIFNVTVLSQIGHAMYVNVTFSLCKLCLERKDEISTVKLKSLNMSKPAAGFNMELNMTLQMNGVKVTMDTKTITLIDVGEYRATVVHMFDRVYPGTYQVTVSYSAVFNQTALSWYCQQLYLTAL
jgi:hypothetical protein